MFHITEQRICHRTCHLFLFIKVKFNKLTVVGVWCAIFVFLKIALNKFYLRSNCFSLFFHFLIKIKPGKCYLKAITSFPFSSDDLSLFFLLFF